MIGLIVARSKNNVIGKNGNIPWKIKGEQKQFRELTTGNVVIMGRKSYEEIGHPLPNRMNIVVSTTTEYQGDNLVSVKSLEDALLLAKGRDVYISGGYGLFKEALQIVDKMYITEVDLNIEDGDTFFPEFDINDFEVLIGETLGEEVKYTRTFYVRKNWLNGHGNDNENIDTYTEFTKDIDTVLMGWNTSHQVVTELSPQEWVYNKFTTYVLTHKECNSSQQIHFTSENPVLLLERLKQEAGKDIWICGGANLVQQLVSKNMIDKYYISVIPTLLGNGVRLLGNIDREIKLRLCKTQTYNGITDLIYMRR